MLLTIKEIQICNFKSLKKMVISPRHFNIIIGPNGVGKTNFLEAFQFLKYVFEGVQSHHLPYKKWWNWKNIIWKREEDLTVDIRIEMELMSNPFIYEISMWGAEGSFQITRELLELKGIVALDRIGRDLEVRHNKDYLEKNKKSITRLKESIKKRSFIFTPHKEVEKVQSIQIDIKEPLLNSFGARSRIYENEKDSKKDSKLSLSYFVTKDEDPIVLISPTVQYKKKISGKEENIIEPVISKFFDAIKELFKNILFIRNPNLDEMMTPQPIKGVTLLNEDGENMVIVLYNMFHKLGMTFPDRINAALDLHFPGSRILFDITSDGRVFLKIKEENGFEVFPPGIPDGLVKMLLYLTAIEQENCDMLLIDEIENSLHAKLLEYILDELKNSDKMVFITTHSPHVVDIVELEDIYLAKKDEGTILEKIPDPVRFRKELREQGLTQSESWLYGDW